MMSKPVALITGASAGIGAELARTYARNGYDLIVTARRETLLQKLADELVGQCQVKTAAVDLALGEGPRSLYERIAEMGISVETLVNNAGVIEIGPTLDTPGERIANLINLNVRALTELVRLFAPPMVERGYGRILNVASLASFQPVPGMSVYGASKAFVLSLTESLSEELRGTGVSVTALCPGPTRTEMADAFKDAQFADLFLADAASVAREGFEASQAGQVIRVPGVMNQALVAWSHYQPRWLVRAFSGFAARTSTMIQGRD